VQIQIGVKSEFHGIYIGWVALYFGNKMSFPLTSFTATVEGLDSEALSVIFTKIPQTVVQPSSQSQQLLQVECKNIFTVPPILQVSFMAGSLQTHRIRLPIILTKFFEPVRLTPEDFFERWKLIGGAPREAQQIFPIRVDSSGNIDSAKQQKVVSGARFQLLPDVDPNPTNIVAAGVLHMSAGGKVGCLIRVEPNRDAKVMQASFESLFDADEAYLFCQLCRLTVRSTSEIVSAEILTVMSKSMHATSQV
jgi:AP-2 complex subunit alpha